MEDPGFLQKLEEPIKAELVEEAPRRLKTASESRALDNIRKIEDKLLEKTMGIVDQALMAGDIDSNTTVPPEEWVRELGQRGAERALRIALDARQNPKMHPVYLDLAKSVMVGIIKARAAQPQERPSLNIAFVLAAPQQQYAILDLEPEK